MAWWREVEQTVPDLAEKVASRFNAHGLGYIATIRKSGAPRISGIEPAFTGGEVWLGMMPGSVKATDLLRDPRCALHSANVDKNVGEGDAKVSGRAVPVEDEETFRAYIGSGAGDPSLSLDGFHLFRLNVLEISHLIPAGDHLDIEWWTEESGYNSIERK